MRILQLAHLLDAETAHDMALGALSLLGRSQVCLKALNKLYGVPEDPVTVRGVTFPNRIGVAAGLDKKAQAWRGLLALGFGHVEVGTLTPLPQPGHLKPRIFRLKPASLANRMGFPNQGAWAAIQRLDRHSGIVGANIGPNSGRTPDEIILDYRWLVEVLAPFVDYFTVNVSSPNSVRHLQTRLYGSLLKDILGEVSFTRNTQEEILGKSLPVFVKISPDLSTSEIEKVCSLCKMYKLDGIVATNSSRHGVSGQTLKRQSTETLKRVRSFVGEEMTLIGVGGIASKEDAEEKFDAGADLLQIYTSFIYRGPGILREILS